MAKRITGLAFAILVICSSYLTHAGDKNSTYAFLRIDNGARSAALAGSFVSIPGDPVTIFYNPAGLGTLRSNEASFGYLKHFLDINSGYAAYGQPFRIAVQGIL